MGQRGSPAIPHAASRDRAAGDLGVGARVDRHLSAAVHAGHLYRVDLFRADGRRIVLLRKRPDYAPVYRVWGFPWVPAIFVAASATIVVNRMVSEPIDSFVGLGLSPPAFPSTTSGLELWLRIARPGGSMSVLQGLRRACQINGNGAATMDGDRRRTWLQFRDRVARFAGALRAAGVQPGDRVAILVAERRQLSRVLLRGAVGGRAGRSAQHPARGARARRDHQRRRGASRSSSTTRSRAMLPALTPHLTTVPTVWVTGRAARPADADLARRRDRRRGTDRSRRSRRPAISTASSTPAAPPPPPRASCSRTATSSPTR